MEDFETIWNFFISQEHKKQIEQQAVEFWNSLGPPVTYETGLPTTSSDVMHKGSWWFLIKDFQ